MGKVGTSAINHFSSSGIKGLRWFCRRKKAPQPLKCSVLARGAGIPPAVAHASCPATNTKATRLARFAEWIPAFAGMTRRLGPL